MSQADRTRIAQEVADDILGHGPLEPLLRDPEVTEIMVNGCDEVFIERGGKIQPTRVRFTDESHLRRTIAKIVSRVGRRVDESSPMVDARLPDGSRVNAVLPPVALDGSLLTIRKFAVDPFTDADLIAFGTMTPATRDFLQACVRGRRNIVISGGTGSGKTTSLNVLSSFLPDDERIITIEDSAELQLHQQHVLRLESRPPNIEGRGEITIRDLRSQRPCARDPTGSRGEARRAAAAMQREPAIRALLPRPCTPQPAPPPHALETMVLMAGSRSSIAGRELGSTSSRASTGQSSRRIVQITEVVGIPTSSRRTSTPSTPPRSDCGRQPPRWLKPTGIRRDRSNDLAEGEAQRALRPAYSDRRTSHRATSGRPTRRALGPASRGSSCNRPVRKSGATTRRPGHPESLRVVDRRQITAPSRCAASLAGRRARTVRHQQVAAAANALAYELDPRSVVERHDYAHGHVRHGNGAGRDQALWPSRPPPTSPMAVSLTASLPNPPTKPGRGPAPPSPSPAATSPYPTATPAAHSTTGFGGQTRHRARRHASPDKTPRRRRPSRD